MMISLPLFYAIPHAQMSMLVFIELLEIVRLLIVWPFASKLRNIFKLSMELIILTYFICGLVQGVLSIELSKNNP